MGSSDQIISEQQNRLQPLFNISADGIILHDAEGPIHNLTGRTIASLGYTREQPLSIEISEVEVGYDDEGPVALWEDVGDGERQTVKKRHRTSLSCGSRGSAEQQGRPRGVSKL